MSEPKNNLLIEIEEQLKELETIVEKTKQENKLLKFQIRKKELILQKLEIEENLKNH